jgi:hypothetical protein
MPIERLVLAVALLFLLCVLGSKAAGRVGVPALLLFLVLGMLAGTDGPGGIAFDDPRLAQSLGVVALTFILFAGGLDTRWGSVRPVLWPAVALATLGVMLTALLVGWFATAVLGFSWLDGLLLGAIISSTDAAAVFGVLRSKRIALKGGLQPLLELESGSNDPMAIFLTLGLTGLLVQTSSRLTLLAKSKMREKTGLHTTSEGQRDRGHTPGDTQSMALEIGRGDLPNRVKEGFTHATIIGGWYAPTSGYDTEEQRTASPPGCYLSTHLWSLHIIASARVSHPSHRSRANRPLPAATAAIRL